MQKSRFPTYLPNQKIQGMGTANKQFFKDGQRDEFSLDPSFTMVVPLFH